MTSRFLIYGLTDPRTDVVRYIGKSTSGLKRPQAHRYPFQLRGKRDYRTNWLRSLAAEGLKPGITVLEEASSAADLDPMECFWIAQGRGLQWPLTNLAKGGTGPLGVKPSAETLAKRSASMMGKNAGRVPSAETRAKLSEARGDRAPNKGKTASPEARERMRAARFQYLSTHPHPSTGRKASAETRLKMRAARLRYLAAQEQHHGPQ